MLAMYAPGGGSGAEGQAVVGRGSKQRYGLAGHGVKQSATVCSSGSSSSHQLESQQALTPRQQLHSPSYKRAAGGVAALPGELLQVVDSRHLVMLEVPVLGLVLGCSSKLPS